jgi:hypothetical protein
VTPREPWTLHRLRTVAQDVGATVRYVEYRSRGDTARGGLPFSALDEHERESVASGPGHLELIYALVDGRLAGLQQLAADPATWRVDIYSPWEAQLLDPVEPGQACPVYSSPPNFFYDAEHQGVLDE